MSQLDELLTRSRAPGAFKDRKHFTLSREKAIEKQREFALRDPKQYVLEIIQGAVFAGATYMAVDARKTDILVAWVGAPALKREELEHLFDYLFANRSDKRIRHLVQLAVGINAILQRRPKAIRLESGSNGTCIRLEMDADGKASIGEVENPIDGTYLVADFGGGFWDRFGFSQSQWTQVETLIENKCLYTPVPILLNGNAPFGFRATRNIEIFGALDQEPFDHGDRRGVIALHTSRNAPLGFRVVTGGVWVADLRLNEVSDQPLVGVICDDNLRKTADHSAIVEDVRYQRMLHAVQPHATTLVRRAVSPTYQPPALAAVAPEEDEGESTAIVEVVFEPVPELIGMVGARGDVQASLLGTDPEEPVFWCTPTVAEEMTTEVAGALRFPFRLLVLTEGQANTLGRDRDDVALHRLNAPADIDFVLRVMERGISIRSLDLTTASGTRVSVRLHLEGRLPAWGNGRAGIPLLVQKNGETKATGVVDAAHVMLSNVPGYRLPVPLALPRVSLVLDHDSLVPAFDAEVVRVVLRNAWKLAAPEEGEVDRDLLASLLGTEAQPHFSEEPHPSGGRHHPDARVELGASLPPEWPSGLRDVPFVDTPDGPLNLSGFLRLVASNSVAWVREPQELARMESLEARFGYGHIARYGHDAAPLFAAVWMQNRWVWVPGPSFFSQGTSFDHMVFVAPHLGARGADDHWDEIERPQKQLIGVRMRGAPEVDFADGWRVLFTGLRRLEEENAWSNYAVAVTESRVRAMGQLSMLQLAVLLEAEDTPLLLPSDGGGRWSIDRLRSDANSRIAAAHGVVVAEPTTFLLDFPSMRTVSPNNEISLRYDDHPDVWRSLAETSAEGWLLRTEVSEVRLKGWLGLRVPYDATCGILLRSTGNLVGLPELERRIPCHGLIWPNHGHHELSEGEEQLLQLAGLKMYAALVDLLKRRLSDEEAVCARAYAWVFCYRAHLRGRLTGTAMQLARQVEVFSEDNRTWGTLDRWLVTSPERRPAPPAHVVLQAPVESESTGAVQGPSLDLFSQRLDDILPGTWTSEVVAVDQKGKDLVDIVSAAGGQRLLFRLNGRHPMVASALDGGDTSRELVLLEVVRKLAQWSAFGGQPLDLIRMQQVLLSQRFTG